MLVTGVNGFIGRQLAPRLEQAGWRVVTLARDRQAADSLPLTHQDPADRWQPYLEGLDAVLHLAGIAHEKAAASAYRTVNAEWPVTLFRAASQAGVKTFIHLSSLKVLGDVSQRPFKAGDGYRNLDGADPYTRSKIDAEHGLNDCRTEHLTATIVRPPLVYGPGVRANFRALLQLARLGRRGVPLPLGRAEAPRSLVSVQNLSSLLCAALNGPAGTYHVRDAQDWTVAGLLAHWGVPRGALLPIPAGAMRRLCALMRRRAWFERLFLPLQSDQTATLAQLDWQPSPCSTQQLDETLAWWLQKS